MSREIITLYLPCFSTVSCTSSLAAVRDRILSQSCLVQLLCSPIFIFSLISITVHASSGLRYTVSVCSLDCSFFSIALCGDLVQTGSSHMYLFRAYRPRPFCHRKLPAQFSKLLISFYIFSVILPLSQSRLFLLGSRNLAFQAISASAGKLSCPQKKLL